MSNDTMAEKGKLIDEIVKLHKEESFEQGNVKKDTFDWNKYILENGTGEDRKIVDIVFAYRFLKDHEMVGDYGRSMTTVLTQKGHDWKGYQAFAKQKRNEQKAQEQDSFVKRYWWAFAAVTYAAGLFTNSLSGVVSTKFFPSRAQSVSKKTYDSIFNNGRIYVIDSLKKDTAK